MISKSVEELIYYAKCHLGLKQEDDIYKKNLLLKYFDLDEPYEGEIDKERIASLKVPDEVLSPVREYLKIEKGLNDVDTELEVGWIMGLLTPLPSMVNDHFHSLYEEKPSNATDYLYDLSIKNNYIAKSQVDKNILWDANYDDGPKLEISINLSKPEKNNKDIAKLLTVKSSSYPKCALCHENLGFAGNQKKPPRENIRFIPIKLDDEQWFMQYSPYVYYPHHLICFSGKHEPMQISRRIISKLFAFVDLFPHYFIGSNADLPIVGGSILDHEHFQGGGHQLPLLKAPLRKKILEKGGVDVSIVDFYDTVIRLDGTNKEKILDLAEEILNKWKKHDDPKFDIIHEDSNGVHSTVTPILKIENGVYQLFMILRNNRCNDAHPDGIFHAHKERHTIKSEGIGLIEAAGLFILPARLNRQGPLAEEVAKGNLDFAKVVEDYPDMEAFKGIIETLKEEKITMKDYINRVCRDILGDVAVYKNTPEAQLALENFIKEASR